MTSAELREALQTEPFRLRFGSGRTIDITNPGLVAVSPGLVAVSSTGRTAFAFKPGTDGFDIIDFLLVEAMEFSGNNGDGHGRKGKKRGP